MSCRTPPDLPMPYDAKAMPSAMNSRPKRPSARLEDAEDYRAFEAAVIADYDALQRAAIPVRPLRIRLPFISPADCQ
jgi:hypothetical protein